MFKSSIQKISFKLLFKISKTACSC